MPEPHDFVHVDADHSVHSPTTQSTGQAWVLQACVSDRAGHAAPPNAAGVTTTRERDWMPEPHDFEHVDADHSVHSPTTQSRGQAWVLQACVSDRAGHAAPPYAAGVTTARERDWMPEPHDFEHVDADHSVHSPTTQFTGLA